MITPSVPFSETKRLRELHAYNILDTAPESDFDDIVKVASLICNVPISHISFIDEKRQWFKAKTGLDHKELKKNDTFCSYTIQGNSPLLISDASKDERFAKNSFVAKGKKIRFYGGFPLLIMVIVLEVCV